MMLRLKEVVVFTAADGRSRFKNGSPSDDAIRARRACNRNITLRVQENNNIQRLSAQTHDHVLTFQNAIQAVENFNPSIHSTAGCVVNFEKTKVDGKYGELIKIFRLSNTHHNGFQLASLSNNNGRHVTAVIEISASGKKTPSFPSLLGLLL